MSISYRLYLLTWISRIIVPVSFIFSASSLAETSVDLYGLSTHSGDGQYTQDGKSQPYNSQNWGIGLTKKIAGPLYIISGLVQNSYYNKSAYAGAQLLKKRRFHSASKLKLTYGLRVFYITGYEDTPLKSDKYLKAGFLQAGIERKKTRLTLGINQAASILFLTYTP
jgi:hypothetical protein